MEAINSTRFLALLCSSIKIGSFATYFTFVCLLKGDADFEDEDEEQREKRSNRQREALICEDTTDTSRVSHKRQHHHLSVNSSAVNPPTSAASAKCPKKAALANSSQQRQRQLQFLRYVHQSHQKINAKKRGIEEE